MYPTTAAYVPQVTAVLFLYPVSVLVACVLIAAAIVRIKRLAPALLRPALLRPALLRPALRAYSGGAASPGNAGYVGAYSLAPALLTDAENHFWAALQAVAEPRSRVLLKPRVADVLVAPEGDRTALARVAQKHFDFLVCHPQTLRPLAAVELDDASHARPDRRDRDLFLDAACASVQLPLLHVPRADHYDRAALSLLLAPVLPS